MAWDLPGREKRHWCSDGSRFYRATINLCFLSRDSQLPAETLNELQLFPLVLVRGLYGESDRCLTVPSDFALVTYRVYSIE